MNKNLKETKAEDLQIGDRFKTKTQRKFRTLHKVLEFTPENAPTMPHVHGKLLLIVEECRQIETTKETIYFVTEEEEVKPYRYFDEYIEWRNSDNVVEVRKGIYKEQTTQWKTEFTDWNLYKFFIKEFCK